MSSSLFTPSHDCRCTNAILRKHVYSLSLFGGSDTATGCGSFYTLHSFTGRWWCVEKALHQISAGSRCPSFCCLLDVLTSHDIASNLRSSRQRTLPQSDSTSFDQRGNRSEETTEQTSKHVPPLDTSAGKVGQCPTHLPRIVVVVINLNSPELHRRKWSVTVTFPVRMALVDPCRPLSLFRRCRIRDSARECTGRGRNGSSPSPRVFLLSALFVEAVQSCRRRYAVQRCSNRRITIRNHASNRRWRRLVQTSNEPTTWDWWCCRQTKHRTRVCRADRRTMWTLSCSSRARWISAWPVRKRISRVLVYRRWASWRVPWDCGNSRLRSTRPFPRCRRVPPSIWHFERSTSRADSVSRWGHVPKHQRYLCDVVGW